MVALLPFFSYMMYFRNHHKLGIIHSVKTILELDIVVATETVF